jgi:chromate reductase, NAD(P)H dehydrogenase (quinone)
MPIEILAISGSLRGGSKNTVLLEAMARLAGAETRVTMYGGLGRLPLFNPDLDDLDNGVAPDEVLAFRAQLAACQGVLICSPEYAHGVAGAMKNALDWLVGSGELVAKPTLVLNASPTSFHAHNALLETLRTMDCKVLDRTMPPPPLGGKSITIESLVDHPERAGFLSAALVALTQSISEQ